MKTIGFPISSKKNEKRRAILPEDIKKISNPERVFIEEGYGIELGISDQEYQNAGCEVIERTKVLQKDIICDPKIGDADYLDDLSEGQTIFGWVHATQNKDITDKIISRKLTAYAWEDMYEEGQHVFWKNNELAGEAAILHAFLQYGKLPFGTQVAVIGRGNTARGAIKVLNQLGANVKQYTRNMEELLRKEIEEYDVIVNCVLWDITRNDHIIYRDDLKNMKNGSMIIDVSCDENGGIETSVPTSITEPTYIIDEVLHYVVDHTPSLLFKNFTEDTSKVLYPYIEELMQGTVSQTLSQALIIKDGIVYDNRINIYQKR